MRRKLILAVLILLAFVLQGTVHRFHRSQSAFDPHSIVWIYERKKGRNVRRIFLRSPD